MSKITNVRLPNSVGPEYSPQQFNQLVRSIEQIIFQLNSNYTPTTTEDQGDALRWFSAAPGAAGFTANTRGGQLVSGNSAPFAMLMSNVDQTNAGVTSENLLSFDLVPVSNGIYIENSTRIKVPAAGHYLVSFSLQVTNRGNSPAEFEVWAKDTGVNFPLSNTRFDVPVRKSSSSWGHVVPSVTGVFSVSNPATDYLEIAWWSDSTDVYIEHYPAGTNPTRPEIPSIILAIAFVSSSAIGGSPTANVAVTLPSVSGTASLGTASAGPAIFVPSGTVVGTGNVSSPTVTGTSVTPVSGIGTFGYAGIVDIPSTTGVLVTGVSGQLGQPQAYFLGLTQSFSVYYGFGPAMIAVTAGSSNMTFSWPASFISFNPTIGQTIRLGFVESFTPVVTQNVVLGGISVNDLLYSNPSKPEFTINDVSYITVDGGYYALWTIDTGQVATSSETVDTGQYFGSALSAKFFTGVGATAAVGTPIISLP